MSQRFFVNNCDTVSGSEVKKMCYVTRIVLVSLEKPLRKEYRRQILVRTAWLYYLGSLRPSTKKTR